MAVPTPPPSGSKIPDGVIPAEWPAQAADTIVDTIAKVRDKTTKPALLAARGLVYGLVAAVIGSLAFFLVLIMIVRIWANYVPGHVWVIYAIFAVVFSTAGFVLLRKANQPKAAPDA
jgi:hypothetical protein